MNPYVNCRHLTACGILAALVCGAFTAVSGEPVPAPRTAGGLEAVIRVLHRQRPVQAEKLGLGAEVRVGLTIRNVGTAVVKVPTGNEWLEYSLQRRELRETGPTLPTPLQFVSDDLALTWSSFQELAPGQTANYTSGPVSLLSPERVTLVVRFANSETKFKKLAVPAGKGPPVPVKELVDEVLPGVWVGDVDFDVELPVGDEASPELDELCREGRNVVRQCETGPLPKAHRRPRIQDDQLGEVNLSQQAEATYVIRRIASGGSSVAVNWLWETFDTTAKNSPWHLQAFGELVFLLYRGIGIEHLPRYAEVALSPNTKESVTTRALAMDVLSWVCMRNNIELNFAGNQDVFVVPRALREQATAALERLSHDELKDLRERAQSILNVKPEQQPQGVRKYVDPKAKDGGATELAPAAE